MTDRNTNTSSQTPQPPKPLALWPKTQGDLTECEAIELVEHLNALSRYTGELVQFETNERLRTQREIELLLSIYRPMLRRYLAKHGDPETHSVTLETGQIWLEKWPAQLHIEDEEAALTWAMKHANAAVDVTIALNGSFDALLTRFMARELPFYLNQPEVFSRTVNLRRLQREWTEINADAGVEVPDGCRVLEAETYVVVSTRRDSRKRMKSSATRGEDDDS